jgi:ATP-dependent Lon protease
LRLDTGLQGFTGRLPLLPLANTVFFPGAVLSFRVIDERQFELLRDVAAGDGRLGIALLRDGWELTWQGTPSTFRVFGIGRLVATRKLPSGGRAAVCRGLARARLLEEIEERPYRVAWVKVLEDLRARSPRVERLVRRAMLTAFRRLLELHPENLLVWDRFRLFDAPLGPVVDHLASNLVIAPRVKQALLEETDVVRRAALLTKALRAMRSALAARLPLADHPLAARSE